MDKFLFRLIILFISLCYFPFNAMAERDDCDFSTNFDAGISKKFFKRLNVGFTEGVSLDQNSSTVDKVSSKVDVSTTVVRKIFKVGISYYAIAKNRKDDYFFNQRFQGYTNVKYTINRITLAWKSRYQLTYRPEKSVLKQKSNCWRNKLTVSGKIPHTHLNPSVGAELFYRINRYKGNVINKLRYEVALKYDFDRHNSLKLYYQYDDAMNEAHPQDMSSLGLSYQFSF